MITGSVVALAVTTLVMLACGGSQDTGWPGAGPSGEESYGALLSRYARYGSLRSSDDFDELVRRVRQLPPRAFGDLATVLEDEQPTLPLLLGIIPWQQLESETVLRIVESIRHTVRDGGARRGRPASARLRNALRVAVGPLQLTNESPQVVAALQATVLDHADDVIADLAWTEFQLLPRLAERKRASTAYVELWRSWAVSRSWRLRRAGARALGESVMSRVNADEALDNADEPLDNEALTLDAAVVEKLASSDPDVRVRSEASFWLR